MKLILRSCGISNVCLPATLPILDLKMMIDYVKGLLFPGSVYRKSKTYLEYFHVSFGPETMPS